MIDFKKHNFFVSCQALKGEPLYGGDTVLKLAIAAIEGGAQGIRTSQINNIKKVQQKNFNVPLIGIIKKDYKNSEVFITATLKELIKIMETGVEIIAIDATLRKRPKETLELMVAYFKKNKQKHQLLMADCSNELDVENAIKLNFDIISTTLRGYTKETKNSSNTENDFAFIKWCINKLKSTKIKIIAEGGINTPEEAKKVLDLGADAVVIGSAITRPKFITEVFLKKIKEE